MKSRWKKTAVLFMGVLLAAVTVPAYAAEGTTAEEAQQESKKDSENVETPEDVTEMEAVSYSRIEAQPVLKWKKVKGAAKYRILRKTGGKKFHRMTTLKKKARTWKDRKAKTHKTYTYRIQALKSDGTVLAESRPLRQKAKKTVLVGDSTMRAIPEYYVLPWRYTVTKIGVNTRSFMSTAYSDYRVGGRATTGMKKLLSLKPDRVFIMMGMNELYWTSVKETVKGYEAIIKKLKKSRPKAEIVIMATSPSSAHPVHGTPSNGKINRLNKSLKKMAKRRKVSYYAWSDVFKDSSGYLKKSCNGGDGCHWTISGARTVVKSIRDYCREHA